MATTYPSTLDSFTNPAGTSPLTSPDHAGEHSNSNDAILAVQTKIGVGSGTPTATNMLLVGNGNGTSQWSGTIGGYQSTYHTLGSAALSPGTATTGTLNLGTATRFLVNMPNAAGQVTLAVSNVSPNQPFMVEILQAASGLGTINWFSTIRWVGSVTPTQTLTASRKDTFGFIATSATTFDGYIVGQNL